MPVGGMIEVPAAALSVGLFVRRLDFLSIGTNDLIQYTLAIDRTDHTVASLYDPFHPAVLRLIAMTIRAARARRQAGGGVRRDGRRPAGDAPAARHGPVAVLDASRPACCGSSARSCSPTSSQLSHKVARLLNTEDPVRVEAGLARLRLDPHRPA